MSDPKSDGANPSGNPHWRAPGPKLPVIPAPVPTVAGSTTGDTAPRGDQMWRQGTNDWRSGPNAGEQPPAWVGPSLDAPAVQAEPPVLPLPTQGSTAQTDPERRAAIPWAAIAAVSAIGATTVVGGLFAAGWSPTAWRLRMMRSR